MSLRAYRRAAGRCTPNSIRRLATQVSNAASNNFIIRAVNCGSRVSADMSARPLFQLGLRACMRILFFFISKLTQVSHLFTSTYSARLQDVVTFAGNIVRGSMLKNLSGGNQ